MHFTTFLKKHFDIEKVVGTSDSGNDTESIYVYEKGMIANRCLFCMNPG